MFRSLLGGIALSAVFTQPVWSGEKAPWSSFRNGFQNSGVSSVKVKKLVNTIDEERIVSVKEVGGLIWGTAVVDSENSVYVGSSNKFFYKFDSKGKELWRYRIYDKADSLIDSAAVLAPNNLVVIPGGDGYLHAVDRTTGERKWDFKAYHSSDDDHQRGGTVNSFEGNVQLGPNNLIYAGSDNGHMYCVDLEGREVWNLKTNMMIWSSPAFSNNGDWMVFGSLDGKVYLVESNSGKLMSTFNVGIDVKSSPSVDRYDYIYVGASNNKVYSLMVEDGKLKKRWEFDKIKGEVYSSPAYFRGTLYVGSLDGTLYAINKMGKLKWSFPTFSPVSSSPLVTKDGVVLFGNKAGKFYALDARKGERIWSYRTTLKLKKSNLDASPTIDRKGMISNGSYDGKIYQIPYEYCLKNTDDKSCEFGGKRDLPAYGVDYSKDVETLRFKNRNGLYSKSPVVSVSPFEIQRLRLVVFKDDELKTDSAISPWRLKVKVTPKAYFETQVAASGRYLNLIPKKPLPPGQSFKVEIKGKYFKKKTWLRDRFSWFGNKKFSHSYEFTVEEEKESKQITGTWAITDLYMEQPEALDTYIPAAMDGQGFLATAYANNGNKFLFHIVAAIPSEEMTLLPEPSKVFDLQAEQSSGSFKTEGSFTIGAMGATIPFKRISLRGKVEDDKIVSGDFFAKTSCLKLRGNDSSYQFPYAMVGQVCDHLLRMKGVGSYKGRKFNKKNPNAKVGWLMVNKKTLLLGASGIDEKKHLLTWIAYDKKSLKVIDKKVKVVSSEGSKMRVQLKAKHQKKSVKWAVFLNHQLMWQK